MTWQLWVLIAAAAIVVVVLVAGRFRRAQRVLDGLIDSIEPPGGETPGVQRLPETAPDRADELARHRGRRQLRTTFVPRIAHGHRSRH